MYLWKIVVKNNKIFNLAFNFVKIYGKSINILTKI
jgi:hypothetical protein